MSNRGWWLATLAGCLVVAGPVKAARTGFAFTPIAALGDPAPGGGVYTDHFEPWALNNHSDLAFATNLDAMGDQGVFVFRGGETTPILRYDQVAPGTNEHGLGDFGIGMNDAGDLGFTWLLAPFTSPLGSNAAAYRYTRATQQLAPVMVPGSTAAPDGKTMEGAGFAVGFNQRGDLAFPGIIKTDQGATNGLADSYPGLGFGVFVAGADGHLTAVATPGDTAPDGGTFSYADNPSLNDGGDVAFVAQLTSDACLAPATGMMSCPVARSIYERVASTGQLKVVVKHGTAAPGGGSFMTVAVPRINNAGDVLFIGTLSLATATAPAQNGVYLYTGGTIKRIAGPGDAMPGGGHLSVVSNSTGQFSLNNQGEVAFNATLDTGDEGVYVYSGGQLQLVAKSGSMLPGIGTVFSLEQGNPAAPNQPPVLTGTAATGTALNDRGQVAFGVSLKDGRQMAIIASPPGVDTPGDVLSAGPVTLGDAVLALRIALGKLTPTAEQAAAADVNGDGKVDLADALLILRRTIGL